MFPPRYVSCSDCGASIERQQRLDHECSLERWLDYRLFHLRDEVARFEQQFGAYLASPRGGFEAWYAQRQRSTG